MLQLLGLILPLLLQAATLQLRSIPAVEQPLTSILNLKPDYGAFNINGGEAGHTIYASSVGGSSPGGVSALNSSTSTISNGVSPGGGGAGGWQGGTNGGAG